MNVACTFLYYIYIELAKRVPTVSGAIVNRILSSYGTACPLITQSVVDESPRYLVFAVMLSILLKLKVLLWQTGSGAQESNEKEDRRSQPPKQYAPTLQCPYSASWLSVHFQTRRHSGILTRAGWCIQGAFIGKAARSLGVRDRRGC